MNSHNGSGIQPKHMREDARVALFKAGQFQCWCCRPEDDTPRAQRALSAQDTYGNGEDVDSTTVQFNTEEEAKESEELAVST